MERVRSIVRQSESTQNDYNALSMNDLRRELYKRNVYPASNRRKCIDRLLRHDAGATDLPAAKHTIKLFTDVEIPSVGSTQYMDVGRPFYGLPFDVMAKHLLPYLDTMSLVSFAQISRQFYRRVMTIAVSRFKVEFKVNMLYIAKTSRGNSDRLQKYIEKDVAMVLRSLDNISPMAIAYYHDISMVKWNKRVKFVSRHGDKTDMFHRRGYRYNREMLKLCSRMDKFGSVDAYKRHVQANSAEVDRELKIAHDRMLENIKILDGLLLVHGYKCILTVRIAQSGGCMHSYFVPSESNLLHRVKVEKVKDLEDLEAAEMCVETMKFKDLATVGLVIDAKVLSLLTLWGAIEKRRIVVKIKV
jgi:hypothetical protein